MNEKPLPIRRKITMASLILGFALAVPLAFSQTGDTKTIKPIKTSAEGLVAGEVKVPMGDKELPAYRAMPEGNGPFPVVIVVHEIWGNHEYIKDVCRRLAKLGYLAVSPEFYAREGGVSHLKPEDTKTIFGIVNQVSDAQVMEDLDATVLWAKKSGKGDTAKLGITGFCWGGRIVWLYAAHNKDLGAGVAWYGHVVGGKDAYHPKDKLHPKDPLDSVCDLKAPVLGLYGAVDKSIPVDTLDKMKEAIGTLKRADKIIVYPQMPHGFHADYRPSYSQPQAEAAWSEMLGWFKKYGVK